MAGTGKIMELYWEQITQQQLPFPTSRAISALPSGNGAIKNSGIADYLGPEFNGIFLRTNGLSGAAERWYIECTQEKVYEKFKIYVNFGNNWYVYELQVWGVGTWIIENPSGQPRIPNQLIIGAVVGVFNDFPPGEASPQHPPPQYNPYEPYITIQGKQDALGRYWEKALGTLHAVTDVTIDAVRVYHDGTLIAVSLQDLLAGHWFNVPGDYEIVVDYHYKNWPQETLRRPFTIITIPKVAYVHLSATKAADNATLPCGKFAFGVFDGSGALVTTTVNG